MLPCCGEEVLRLKKQELDLRKPPPLPPRWADVVRAQHGGDRRGPGRGRRAADADRDDEGPV